ncbi:ADP-ribose pyrophosphatase YjhB, NUDIX family [Thiohalospira halophila DSM 15071]|uniref:Phosphatase NudJ n=1 Tax=Thiohalospira halophila DSM 15071 TaxID=1123397 RepID=A0A1I1NZM6_9GAMM|nr:NUDIX hydrolase [Thiohalospira halophila]SFD03039.1 ADP-ribose pyrophosphatase YjhB, NUDIX family [Thiohalospira halophila DSM 15071]
MVWKPRTTVAAVIEADGRYLLVEEADAEGNRVLNQPAGHLEPGESLEAAVIREVAEETRRDFTPGALVGIYRWDGAPDGSTFMRFTFAGSVGEEIAGRERDADILATHWLTAEEVREAGASGRLRSPLVARTLEDYLRGERYPLTVLQEV